jgi:hypothetical protein
LLSILLPAQQLCFSFCFYFVLVAWHPAVGVAPAAPAAGCRTVAVEAIRYLAASAATLLFISFVLMSQLSTVPFKSLCMLLQHAASTASPTLH